MLFLIFFFFYWRPMGQNMFKSWLCSVRQQTVSRVRRTPCSPAGTWWRRATPSMAAPPWSSSPRVRESTASCWTRSVPPHGSQTDFAQVPSEVGDDVLYVLLHRRLASSSSWIETWRSRNVERSTAWTKATPSTSTRLWPSICRRRSSPRYCPCSSCCFRSSEGPGPLGAEKQTSSGGHS